MIILKHLRVEHFRLLREIDLHFPQQGSIFIQGPNEAGKSTLFESIYFALYGEPITPVPGGHSQASLDDLIYFGATHATVMLTLSMETTELAITREIERSKGQQVTVQVLKPALSAVSGQANDAKGETITRLDVANERIISELGSVDGDALRNSCFIEQKGLNRLEELHDSEREATVRKLLGLEKLFRLTEQFKVTPTDEELLAESRNRLKLAIIQARIPELSVQLGKVEEALDAVTVSEYLAVIGQQEKDIAAQEFELEQLQTKRSKLRWDQVRTQQLKKAEATLDDIIIAYDTLAEAQHEIPELERQIAELDRYEREDLPALEKRENDLVDLIHSFGTLERMSNDLLTTVSTIKELEQELAHYEALHMERDGLDEQIVRARFELSQVRQELVELEEQRHTGRPQIEARLQRLQGLAEAFTELHQVEQQLSQRLTQRGLAEENKAQLKKVEEDIQEAEHKLLLVEAQAQMIEEQAAGLEKRWRQLSLRGRLEEWQRVKGLSQGLAAAEQHLKAAQQQQEQEMRTASKARFRTARWLSIVIICPVLALLLVGAAFFVESQHQPLPLAISMGILAFVLLICTLLSVQNYQKARKGEQVADQRKREAISHVEVAVAGREAALQLGGTREQLEQVEQEIRSLQGVVPGSFDEAQHFLQQMQVEDESFAYLQLQLNEKRDSVLAACGQVDLTREVLTALQNERAQLEEQQKSPAWNDIETKIRSDQQGIEQKQQEISMLVGQEGLPIPSFDSSITSPGISETEMLVAEAIAATEQEIAALDRKLGNTAQVAAKVKLYQDGLEVLLARRQVLSERLQHFVAGQREAIQAQSAMLSDMQFKQDSVVEEVPIKENEPKLKLERAHEQQRALRNALQSLQELLRQRVKALGITFEQAAIVHAEVVAHTQLESLHFTLGKRVEAQSRRTQYLTALKEAQNALSVHYRQLAKLSGTLGSWLVPPNPFAETLLALRTRCQREVLEANEKGIMQELEQVDEQESACKARIEQCRQKVEGAQERIVTVLAQHSRPLARHFTYTDVVAVWPLVYEQGEELVAEHLQEKRSRLEAECQLVEQELQELEQQELDLGVQLQVNGQRIDLEHAQARLEQQERSYQTKKHGNRIVKAVSKRLVSKTFPRIERSMREILPLLTGGRYQDIHLGVERAAEEAKTSTGYDNSGTTPFRLEVWDAAAGRFVSKSTLSGGSADQLSLALRLAFAIAVLPRDLESVPGFVMLDEPLSSFDRKRTQALVDLITGEMLGQHFEQVLFISHSSTFDPAMFPYHINMDSGAVVESNLPVAPVTISASLSGEDPPTQEER